MNQCHANQILDHSAVSREQTLRERSSQLEGQSLNKVAFSATSEPISILQRGGETVGGSEGESERSQSHCTRTSVCFVESHSAHVSSAH